jgi:predicted alpha/beta-fold hydrolase
MPPFLWHISGGYPLFFGDFEARSVQSDFRPLPLLGNKHVQTLLGCLLRERAPTTPTRRSLVPLADGDQVVIYDDVPDNWRPGRPIAVMVHGLGGTHRSGHVLRVTRLLLPEGIRVVRLDQRGCGRSLPLCRRTYHGGSSGDLRTVLDVVRSWCPTSPLFLVGFSLGGNIVLKLAGEVQDHPVPNLARVVALAPPTDLERCAWLLSQAHNRMYEEHFLRELVALAKMRRQYFPDLPPVRLPAQPTLRQFDDTYTAPRCGFTDALDYYRRSSSLPLLPNIAVPTLILTARDDPFVCPMPLEKAPLPDCVDLRIYARGGHLGFLGWDGVGGFRWAERRIAEWLHRAAPR